MAEEEAQNQAGHHAAHKHATRPKVFTASTALPSEPVQLSITGRAPKNKLLSPLEKDVVEQMVGRGEKVGEDVAEAYRNTIEEEERKAEAARKKAEEEKLKAEEEAKAQAAKEAHEIAAAVEEAQGEPAPAPVETKVEEAIQPEPPATQEQAPELTPMPEPAPIAEEAQPQAEESKPRIVQVNEIPQAASAPVEAAATQTPEGDGDQRHHAHLSPTPAAQASSKPRIVSMVDYGVIANSPRARDSKLAQMASDLSANGASSPAQEAEARPLTVEEQRQQAADLARKIYEEKRRRSSLSFKLGKFLGLVKEGE